MKSSFPDHDENMVTVGSNFVSITGPAGQMVLVSNDTVLFVHSSLSPNLVSHG
jgi:hypothetical protein